VPNATTDQLPYHRAPYSPAHSFTILAHQARPLALCRMPRLTSYHIIARLILPRIPSPSSRIRHAPGPVPGDATTDKLPSLRALNSRVHSFTILAHLGTPLAPCQGMPRLTSYHIIARLILPCIPSPSSCIRHAPGRVPGDATTDKLPSHRAPYSPVHSFTILAHQARPWPRRLVDLKPESLSKADFPLTPAHTGPLRGFGF
jgi:hypothetical protein